MIEIHLLDFFRTGTFGGTLPGMSRTEIEAQLGLPDDFLPGLDNPPDYATAAIWIYGGVELSFVDVHQPEIKHLLREIYFKPHYLFGQRARKTKIQRWIFRSRQGPTKQQLINALTRQKIPFQDTGLQMALWDESILNWRVREFQEHLLQSPDWAQSVNECFGTLVLRNGIQIRYDELGHFLRVSSGTTGWWFKGKEANVTWATTANGIETLT